MFFIPRQIIKFDTKILSKYASYLIHISIKSTTDNLFTNFPISSLLKKTVTNYLNVKSMTETIKLLPGVSTYNLECEYGDSIHGDMSPEKNYLAEHVGIILNNLIGEPYELISSTQKFMD